MKADGTKNDYERNAAKRLYSDARREHPHLKFIVAEDSIVAWVPHAWYDNSAPISARQPGGLTPLFIQNIGYRVDCLAPDQ
jgi:hypothetical protein